MRRQQGFKKLAILLITIILVQLVALPMEKSSAVDGNYQRFYRYERYKYVNYGIVFFKRHVCSMVSNMNDSEQQNTYYSYELGDDGINLKQKIESSYKFRELVYTQKIYYDYSKINALNYLPVDEKGNIDKIGNKYLFESGGTEAFIIEKKNSTVSGRHEVVNIYTLDYSKKTKTHLIDPNIIAPDGAYPNDGVQGDYYYIKREMVYNAPTVNLAQSEGVGYPCTDSMKISGSFKDLDTDQVMCLYYNLENAATGQVISHGKAAENRVCNGLDNYFEFTYPLDPNFPVGAYNMVVWAQDDRGYKSAIKTIRMDKIAYPPTLTVNQPEGVNNPRTDSMMVSGTFKDLDKHQSVSVKYSLEDSFGTVIKSGVACNDLISRAVDHDFTYTVPLDIVVPLGTFKLKLWAQDDQGYKSPVRTVTVEKVAANQVKLLSATATTNSLTFDYNAEESPYPLKAAPYRVKVSQNGTAISSTDWVGINTIISYMTTVKGLKPNLPYTLSLEAINVKEAIGQRTETKYTLAEIPVLTAEMKREKQLNIKIADENPINTQYKILIKDKAGVIKEVNNLGRLVDAGDNWLALGASKSISITDPALNPGISYTITAVAKNGENIVTAPSIPVLTNVAIDKPVKLTKADITPSSKEAKVSWTPVKDAVSYKIKLFSGEKLLKELTTMDTVATMSDLAFDSKYVLEIIASNDAGDSEVHKEYFQTKPAEFTAPKILKEACSMGNYAITFKWEAIPKSFGYQVEADGEIYSVGKETNFEHEGLPPNSRHVYRVRTLNQKGFSSWSEKISLQTTKNPPITNAEPCNVSVTDDSMILNWKPVKNASSYEIGYNGGVRIENGSSNFCIRTGLKADTQYDYSVWAVSEFGQSSLIASGTTKTMALKTPKIDKVEETPEGFLVTWTAVAGADGYKVQQDGQDLGITITQPKYEIKGIGAKEVKNFSFAAVGIKGNSAWSKEISVEGISKLPQKPVNVSSTASSNMIVLTWADSEPDNDILYEVEVDGTPMESADKNKYKDELLEPFSTHIYRVRSKNTFAYSAWTEPISVKTLPGVPIAPKNIFIDNSTYFATLSWDEAESVTGYEVAIKQTDGTFKIVKVGGRNLYRQRGVLNVEQTYKVRGMNVIGTGEWSKLIVNNAIKANCKKEKEIELGLTASQIVDFEKYELQVTYNPGAMDVIDLCGYSIEKELTIGKIKGTDIEVVSFVPGKIIFKVTKGIEQGYMWTGVVNNIKFKAKHAGGSYISYTVFIDESIKNTSETAKKE